MIWGLRKTNSVIRSVVEKVLEVGPTFDYRSRAFLKIPLYPFQEWSSDLHLRALVKGNFVRRVPKLGVIFENLVDLLSQTRGLLSQLVLSPGDFLPPYVVWRGTR
jgi:hypothetical protein